MEEVFLASFFTVKIKLSINNSVVGSFHIYRLVKTKTLNKSHSSLESRNEMCSDISIKKMKNVFCLKRNYYPFKLISHSEDPGKIYFSLCTFSKNHLRIISGIYRLCTEVCHFFQFQCHHYSLVREICLHLLALRYRSLHVCFPRQFLYST